jgi:uncharacterized membrane protein
MKAKAMRAKAKAMNCDEKVMMGACCAAIAMLVPVALYQMGVTGWLPDPPGKCFDSKRVVRSKAARPFGVPDGVLGIASFSATLALAVMAGRCGGARKLLGAKLAMDASAAAFNVTRQIKMGKMCSWCTGTAIAAGVMAHAGRKWIAETGRQGS